MPEKQSILVRSEFTPVGREMENKINQSVSSEKRFIENRSKMISLWAGDGLGV